MHIFTRLWMSLKVDMIVMMGPVINSIKFYKLSYLIKLKFDIKVFKSVALSLVLLLTATLYIIFTNMKQI